MDNIFSNSSKKKTSSSHNKTSTRKKSSSHKSDTPESISIKVKSKSPQTIQEFNLKFPEPLPDKINFDEKIAKKMSALIDKHEDIKPFMGNTLFKDIFYLYLFNKYKTNCLLTQKYENSIPEMRIYINKDEPNINDTPLKHLAKKIVKCISQNEPIIIIPLSLKITTIGETSGHANLLIYRNNTRQLEHFEPHGWDFQGYNESSTNDLVNETLDKDLNYLVKNINDELDKKELLHIKLVKAYEVCPYLNGVQGLEEKSRLPDLPIEPDGYCVAWCMFFVEMCLKNPEIPSKQIYKGILDERLKQGGNIDYFKKIIRGYTCFINNKMAKYFTEILGYEATSEKLHSYHKERNTTGVNPPEMNILLYKLNYLINKEGYPNHPEDITGNKILKDTLKKYTSFKKTIRKNTSSSDLSSKERESRRNRRQLKKDYNTKLLEFIDRKTAKEKERKATEKIRKAEEKERKATETQRKLEEKERKATEKQRKLEEKERKATEQATEKQEKLKEKEQKVEEKKRKATEQAEEKERKVTEKLRKAEEKLLSKTAKSRPKTTKAKTLKMTTSLQKSSPNP
jgi:hypothetical protein